MTFACTLLAITIPFAHLTVPVAIFVAITAGVWWAMSAFGDRSEPMVDERLEYLKHPRGKGPDKLSADDKSKKKSDALAAALERATQPLATKVTGNEAEMSKLRERLLHAGFRRESAPVVFKGSQVLLGLCGLFLGGVFGLVTEGFSFKLILRAMLGGGLLYYLPELLLSLAGKKRKEAIFLGLPDALDLMVVCVEAGLGLDQALRKVGDEMTKSHKVIAEEMNVANQQMQFGRPRSEVLQALGIAVEWTISNSWLRSSSKLTSLVAAWVRHCGFRATQCESNDVKWPKKKRRRQP